MTSMTEHLMGLNHNENDNKRGQVGDFSAGQPAAACDAGAPASADLPDAGMRLQCQRILACTARALASSPGGLRFKAGSRPWLAGLDTTAAAPKSDGKAAPAVRADRAVRSSRAPFFGAFFIPPRLAQHGPVRLA